MRQKKWVSRNWKIHWKLAHKWCCCRLKFLNSVERSLFIVVNWLGQWKIILTKHISIICLQLFDLDISNQTKRVIVCHTHAKCRLTTVPKWCWYNWRYSGRHSIQPDQLNYFLFINTFSFASINFRVLMRSSDKLQNLWMEITNWRFEIASWISFAVQLLRNLRGP